VANPSIQLKGFVEKQKKAGLEPDWEMINKAFSEGYSFGYADGTTNGITEGLDRAGRTMRRIATGVR